jgi:hypothetical protein
MLMVCVLLSTQYAVDTKGAAAALMFELWEKKIGIRLAATSHNEVLCPLQLVID